MRWTALLLTLMGVGGIWAAADNQPKPADDAWAPDVQDVVFLGETRPILIRLHLTLDGKPAIMAWNETMARLFKYLDRDEDGVLNKQEVTTMPSDTMLAGLFQGINFQITPSPPQFTDVDADGDGKVSLTEFLRYYISNGYGPVRVLATPGQNVQSRSITQLIFGLLDTNRDGKLSRTELESSWRVLQRYDENDDELITVPEMRAGVESPVADTMPAMPQPVNILDPRGRTRTLPAPILVVDRDESAGKMGNRLKLAKEIVTRYDRNKNKLASKEELGFSRELFDQLKLKDGELDGPGLIRWMVALPDLEIGIRAGGSLQSLAPIEIRNSPERKVPFLPLKRMASTALAINLGRMKLNLVQREGSDGYNTARLLPNYLEQMKVADTRKKGFVTLKQLEAAQFRPLKLLFPVADRDEDGKLTEQELQDYIRVTAGVMDAVTSLIYSDHGQGLFELIDTNKDGRLTQRELRNTVQLVQDYDQNQDDALSLAEIPRQLQITIARGPTPDRTSAQNVVVQQTGGIDSNAMRFPTEGPLWFRKMDVNSDGDVTLREFLGTPEDFARIDQDGDGLISLAEAITADKVFREKLKDFK